MLVADVDMSRRSLRRRWPTASAAEVDYSIAATIASRRRVSAGASVDRLAPRHWTDRYGPHRQWLSSQRQQQQQQQQRASDVGGLRCRLHLPISDSISRSSAHIRPTTAVITFTYLRHVVSLSDECQLQYLTAITDCRLLRHVHTCVVPSTETRPVRPGVTGPSL